MAWIVSRREGKKETEYMEKEGIPPMCQLTVMMHSFISCRFQWLTRWCENFYMRIA